MQNGNKKTDKNTKSNSTNSGFRQFSNILEILNRILREKCPYSELLWSVLFGLNTERYVVSPHIQSECGKYGPEKLRIRTFSM